MIEDIKREALAAVPRKKIKNKIMTAKAVSSTEPKSQPRTKRNVESVNTSKEIPNVQEIDVHVDNVQKVKKNLDEFGEKKKKKEWSEVLAQVLVGSRLKDHDKEINDKKELCQSPAPLESEFN